MNTNSVLRWERLAGRVAAGMGATRAAEPASVLEAVAAHREYWRPADVRVLLLAESHVLTAAEDLEAIVSLAPFGHPNAPFSFVRLVYCLGYGESHLMPQKMGNNAGTPQFWKLFAACTGAMDGGRTMKFKEPDPTRRVRAKIELLEVLKRRGVWLLDACPVALYAGGVKKPPAVALREALRVSWEEYTCEVVKEASPQAVVVIGKMVFDMLGEKLKSAAAGASIDWIYQP